MIVNRKSEDKVADETKTGSKFFEFELIIFIDQPGSDATTDKPKESKIKTTAKEVTESQQSGTSSLNETSEDEEAKRKEAEKAKAEKALDEKQLTKLVEINLQETDTSTIFFIPSIVVPQMDAGVENPEYPETDKRNKKYVELCSKKISSDAFIERGSQTMNPT